MNKPKCECGWDTRLPGCPVHNPAPAGEPAPLSELVEKWREQAQPRLAMSLVCPFCGGGYSWVKRKQNAEDGSKIRRSRACLECGRVYHSIEKVEPVPPSD